MNFQLSTFNFQTFIHPLCFLHVVHSFAQRDSYISFGINSLRTLSYATEGVSPFDSHQFAQIKAWQKKEED
jgi:hypothetical protein